MFSTSRVLRKLAKIQRSAHKTFSVWTLGSCGGVATLSNEECFAVDFLFLENYIVEKIIFLFECSLCAKVRGSPCPGCSSFPSSSPQLRVGGSACLKEPREHSSLEPTAL
jgi:hypothetical protein